jgi:cytoskeletal protein RodZ
MIEALERDDVGSLPPRPYLRGFVAAYGRELGLDPAEAVARYFAEFKPPPAEAITVGEVSRSEPSYTRALGIAGLVLAVLLLVPVVNRWRAGVEPPLPPVAGTTGTAPAVPSAATGVPAAAAAPAATDQGALVPVPGELVVSLAFERPCWLAASTDGTRVVYRTMEPGSTQVLKAQREISIRVGDAGAVAWSVNGRAAGPLGGAGEVRTLTVTPANSASVR